MILNVQDRMSIIEDLTQWVSNRLFNPPPKGTNWREHCTLSTGVLNGIVAYIAKDIPVASYNLRHKHWYLLKRENPDLFSKVKFFIRENSEAA
jgi:hypothetical protein